MLEAWKGGNDRGLRRAAAMRSVPEVYPDATTLAQLRDNLIDVTVALADELATDGDIDRLDALATLYEQTTDALRRRELRRVR
jgi:hypothetical protein